jgi:hypothetical protein
LTLYSVIAILLIEKNTNQPGGRKMKVTTDEQIGFNDRKAGYYDKWYRYNRADSGAAYDKGCTRAAADNCPEHFTLIEVSK